MVFTYHVVADATGYAQNRAYAAALRESDLLDWGNDTLILLDGQEGSFATLPLLQKEFCVFEDGDTELIQKNFELTADEIDMEERNIKIFKRGKRPMNIKLIQEDMSITPLHCETLSTYELLLLTTSGHVS